MIYYAENNGQIIKTTPFENVAKTWESYKTTEKNIVYGYNGKLYFSDETPEKPQELINQERIEELKALLAAADYWGQKYIDGEYTDEEWEEKKAQRKAWREEIRRLEPDIPSGG